MSVPSREDAFQLRRVRFRDQPLATRRCVWSVGARCGGRYARDVCLLLDLSRHSRTAVVHRTAGSGRGCRPTRFFFASLRCYRIHCATSLCQLSHYGRCPDVTCVVYILKNRLRAALSPWLCGQRTTSSALKEAIIRNSVHRPT